MQNISAKKTQELFRKATQHHQSNRLDEAQLYYQEILRHAPNHADALHLSGLIFAERGKPEKGLELISKAIKNRNNFPPFYQNRGLLYHRLNQYALAIDDFNHAIKLDLRSDKLLSQLGDALLADQKADTAITAYQQALQLNSKNYQAQHNLGNAYLAKRAYQEAIGCYTKTLSIKQDLPETLSNLGIALYELGRFTEVIIHHNQALQLNSNFYQAHINLGLVYNRLKDFAQAETHYRQALTLAPQQAEIYLNLGVNFKDQNRVSQAITTFREALKLKPDYPEAEFNEAISLLLQGDFAEGLPKYEARLKLKERQNDIHYPYPRWQGEDLAGKTLLVHAEQGIGDTLQFVRYLKLLPSAAKVTLACQPELMSLFAEDYCIIPRAVPKEKFDYQIPIMSLPLIFKTTLESIPFAEGYITAPQNRPLRHCEEQRDEAIHSLKKVGLVWAGGTQHRNDHNRSISLELFESLLAIQECQFYSLQCGTRGLSNSTVIPAKAGIQRENTVIPAKAGIQKNIIDLTPHINDFSDTAALLTQLDLLITVDTSIAHLGGALAIPTWILLPYAPDFRWLLGHTDSPWYRSVKLFRQPSVGDWNAVIENVATQLRLLCGDL